jgi:predicted transcriptional regulator
MGDVAYLFTIGGSVTRLKNRESMLVHMEILASLFASPKGPTRLSQACNINSGRIGDYTDALLAKKLIRAEIMDKREVYFITQEGLQVYNDWLEIWKRLPLG